MNPPEENYGAGPRAVQGLDYLTYFSLAVARFSQADLKQLLETCCRLNATQGMTGLLLYRDGRFLQYLEGPRENVRATFEHVRMDKRHFSVRTVSTGPLEGRVFSEWSMGFKNLSGIRASNTAGYSECLQPNFLPQDQGDPAERLTKLFYALIEDNAIPGPASVSVRYRAAPRRGR